MDLKHAVDLFLLHLSADGYSQNTEDLYRWALQLLNTYLNNPQLGAIQPVHLDQFWSWLRNEYQPKRKNQKNHPLTGRSLENIWTAQRSFFGWCHTTGKLRRRPDLHIRKPEYAERIIEPLTEDEIIRLLEAARHTRIANTKNRTPFTSPRATALRDTAIIMVLAETGIRVSECARLVRRDINFDDGTITIQPFGTGRKTRHRVLEIGKKTRLTLWEYLAWREEREGQEIAPDELVFRTLHGNPMNKDSIRQVLDEIGRSAGIPNVHPHRFRHFFASMMAADDMGESELMEKIGHTTAKMTRRYIHLHRMRRKKRDSIIDRLKNNKR